jgi:uncharacterized SAM-dependent methyltransferase
LQPEYCPKRPEKALLAAQAERVEALACVTDFLQGSDSADEARLVLAQMVAAEPARHYIPVDAVGDGCREGPFASSLRHRALSIAGVIADFGRQLHGVRVRDCTRIVVVPGTIGTLPSG